MKKILALFLSFMFFVGLNGCGGGIETEVDVIIIAGQSNALGLSPISDLIEEEKITYKDIFMFGASNKSYEWENQFKEVAPGLGHTTQNFGLELGAAKAMKKRTDNKTAYILKYGSDGTALYDKWKPPSNNDFVSLMNLIDNGLKGIKDKKLTPIIKGFIFMQGESDALIQKYANAYEENLTEFISAVRENLKLPNLKIVLGQINPVNPVLQYREKVINAQKAVAEKMEKVCFVDTSDLTEMCDLFHYGAESMLKLGERLAEKVYSN